MNRVYKNVNIVIPPLLMLVLMYVSFLEPFKYRGLTIVLILIIYPIILFVQGLLCPLTKGNVFLTLGFSIFIFLIITLIWLNSSALIYVLLYFVMGVIGYGYRQ